jgi:signal transduction histidine kinase
MVEYQYGQPQHHLLHAREQERKLIARELHDRIISALVGLSYQLSDVQSHLGAETKPRIAHLQDHVRQTIDHVRHICGDLRPPSLDRDLVTAIRCYVHSLAQQVPFQILLRVEGDPEQHVPPDVALCLFRVLQEALTNVRKHAFARRAEVVLLLRRDAICLTVQDDGKGFCSSRQSRQPAEDRHFGLLGVRERLELVCGTLTIASEVGAGTCLSALVPLLAHAPRQHT